MKKKILLAGMLIGIMIFLSSCDSGKQSNGKDSAQVAKPLTKAGFVQETLDGVDSITATAMVRAFYSGQDTISRIYGSFLIKKDTLHKMVKLLSDELTYEQNHRSANGLIDSTDGMRIYFAVNPKIPKTISLLLVATRDSVNVTSSDKMIRHRDYYLHSTSSDLVKLNLKGIIYEPVNTPGTQLYNTCTNCVDDNSCGSNPHYLKRADAEIMVQSYKNKPTGVLQTESEWFGLDQLEAIAQDTRCDGLRIYFARRKSNDTYKKPLRECVVLTTTEHVSQNVYQDYFDCKTYQSLSIKYKPGTHIPLYPAQDNGGLCPNNCN